MKVLKTNKLERFCNVKTLSKTDFGVFELTSGMEYFDIVDNQIVIKSVSKTVFLLFLVFVFVLLYKTNNYRRLSRCQKLCQSGTYTRKNMQNHSKTK